MTFLTPLLAGIAAAIAVPSLIILYFLKLRRRDLEISTTLLWKKSIQDLQANAPFQKLRRNILLILQLIVLAGVLLALGQPQIKSQTLIGQKQIILIDRSASMSSLDEDDGKGGMQSRLDAAKKAALALVNSLREGSLMGRGDADEAMVIVFDVSAEVRQQFTGDKASLRRAIEAIEPSDSPTRIEEAMRLALAHQPRRLVEGKAVEGLAGGAPVTFHIYSDGRLPDANSAKPGPENKVVYHRVGKTDAANIGIVSLRADRSFDNPAKLSIHVGLTNNEASVRSVDVELVVDSEVAGIKMTTVNAAVRDDGSVAPVVTAIPADSTPTSTPTVVRSMTPGIGGVVFQLDRAEGAVVQVRLRGSGTGQPLEGDVLALDDRAWVVVPPAKRMAVAVVSDKSDRFLLTSVLEGLPLSRLTELTTTQYEDLARQEKLAEYDVVILDGYVPKPVIGGDGEPGLPPGRFLLIDGIPDLGTGLKDGGAGGSAGIIDWARDHPVLRAVSLDSLTLGNSRKVEIAPGSPISVLASADTGPAILELSKADTRALIVTFDIGQSTWPWDAGFVVFFGAAVKYLGEDGGEAGSLRQVQPGAVLSDRLPSDATSVELKGPAELSQRLIPAADGRIVFGPIQKTGVYTVTWTGSPGPTDLKDGDNAVRVYSANLSDGDESNAAATDTIPLASDVVQASGEASANADKRLWPWFILAALAVMMLEWFVYNRKVHV